MWKLFRNFWRRIAPFRIGMSVLGVFLFIVVVLPLRAAEFPAAYEWWTDVMPPRETLLIVFSLGLVLYVIWIDARPYVLGWWSDRRQDGEQVLDKIIRWWIIPRSAWARWQRAQGVADEMTMNHHLSSAITHEVEIGEIVITARKKKEVEREKLSQDFWRVASLEVRKDPIRGWSVFIRPRDGLPEEVVKKIVDPDYVDLTARWSDVKRLWPEHDRLIDAETNALLRKKKLKP